jgi:hypothetical protein
MMAGTNLRIRDRAMRQGAVVPGLAILECGSSRRRTVMLALHRYGGVIREYQSDSSSKSPVSSVTSCAPDKHLLEPGYG